MTRATKIVATLGPASSDPAVLERLLRAGVDVVRLNFSHGTAADHIARAQLVRDTAERVGKPVALMADLQGPEDPRRQVRRGQGDAAQRRGLRARRLAHHAGRRRRRGAGLQGTAARRAARRHAAAQRRHDRAHGRQRARRAGAHAGQGRRRAVQQQGHQQAGRWPDGAGADRQGHGGHQDRGGLPVRLPGGELPEERHRHGDGAPAGQRGRRVATGTSRR